MVEFRTEAGDAIRSFHAIQAGSCGFTAQINDRHNGYWIRCKINKPILALNQRQNISYTKWISNLFSFHKKGWLKPSTCKDRMVSTRNVTTCGISNNWISGKPCLMYNAGNAWYHRWFTAQIKGNHCGYWICRKKNEARLALGQAQNVTCHNWISSWFFSPKKVGWKPSTCNS